MLKAIAIAALAAAPLPVFADGFAPVKEKAEFVRLIQDKKLTRFGISLRVSETGAINGSAFGSDVTGSWSWKDGLFCRDLAYGSTDLGWNCQAVQRNGDTLRFTSDAGKGDSADLRLR